MAQQQDVQDAIKPLQEDMDKLQEELDRNRLRPAQKEAFECSAKCCDARSDSQEFQRCLNKCNEKAQRVTEAVNGELQAFQSKVQRCVEGCQGQAQAQLEGGGGEKVAEKRLSSCVKECAESYRKAVPKLRESLLRSSK